MSTDPAFAHVRWLGGAPDAGKTTVACRLAEHHGLALYEYDRTDPAHHQRLAATDTAYHAFLDATMDERWLAPTPEHLRRTIGLVERETLESD